MLVAPNARRPLLIFVLAMMSCGIAGAIAAGNRTDSLSHTRLSATASISNSSTGTRSPQTPSRSVSMDGSRSGTRSNMSPSRSGGSASRSQSYSVRSPSGSGSRSPLSPSWPLSNTTTITPPPSSTKTRPTWSDSRTAASRTPSYDATATRTVTPPPTRTPSRSRRTASASPTDPSLSPSASYQPPLRPRTPAPTPRPPPVKTRTPALTPSHTERRSASRLTVTLSLTLTQTQSAVAKTGSPGLTVTPTVTATSSGRESSTAEVTTPTRTLALTESKTVRPPRCAFSIVSGTVFERLPRSTTPTATVMLALLNDRFVLLPNKSAVAAGGSSATNTDWDFFARECLSSIPTVSGAFQGGWATAGPRFAVTPIAATVSGNGTAAALSSTATAEASAIAIDVTFTRAYTATMDEGALLVVSSRCLKLHCVTTPTDIALFIPAAESPVIGSPTALAALSALGVIAAVVAAAMPAAVFFSNPLLIGPVSLAGPAVLDVATCGLFTDTATPWYEHPLQFRVGRPTDQEFRAVDASVSLCIGNVFVVVITLILHALAAEVHYCSFAPLVVVGGLGRPPSRSASYRALRFPSAPLFVWLALSGPTSAHIVRIGVAAKGNTGWIALAACAAAVWLAPLAALGAALWRLLPPARELQAFMWFPAVVEDDGAAEPSELITSSSPAAADLTGGRQGSAPKSTAPAASLERVVEWCRVGDWWDDGTGAALERLNGVLFVQFRPPYMTAAPVAVAVPLIVCGVIGGARPEVSGCGPYALIVGVVSALVALTLLIARPMVNHIMTISAAATWLVLAAAAFVIALDGTNRGRPGAGLAVLPAAVWCVTLLVVVSLTVLWVWLGRPTPTAPLLPNRRRRDSSKRLQSSQGPANDWPVAIGPHTTRPSALPPPPPMGPPAAGPPSSLTFAHHRSSPPSVFDVVDHAPASPSEAAAAKSFGADDNPDDSLAPRRGDHHGESAAATALFFAVPIHDHQGAHDNAPSLLWQPPPHQAPAFDRSGYRVSGREEAYGPPPQQGSLLEALFGTAHRARPPPPHREGTLFIDPAALKDMFDFDVDDDNMGRSSSSASLSSGGGSISSGSSL